MQGVIAPENLKYKVFFWYNGQMKLFRRYFCLFLAALFILSAACARRGPTLLDPARPTLFERGVASWYGADFHGRRTANGEIYDMYKLTAAHQFLPFNTIVEVENENNGRRVLVRINDRGPFVKGRIIDLSLAAARRLDMVGTGTAPVAVRVADPTLKRSPDKRPPRVGFYLQAGAFREQKNAAGQLRKITALIPGDLFSIVFNDGLYRVCSKNFTSRTEAEELRRRLAAHGIASLLREKFL